MRLIRQVETKPPGQINLSEQTAKAKLSVSDVKGESGEPTFSLTSNSLLVWFQAVTAAVRSVIFHCNHVNGPHPGTVLYFYPNPL